MIASGSESSGSAVGGWREGEEEEETGDAVEAAGDGDGIEGTRSIGEDVDADTDGEADKDASTGDGDGDGNANGFPTNKFNRMLVFAKAANFEGVDFPLIIFVTLEDAFCASSAAIASCIRVTWAARMTRGSTEEIVFSVAVWVRRTHWG